MEAATLYDDDIVTWSEQQATALRRLASKPDLSHLVDWDNIIEEIECLGRSEWSAVESLLTQALAHVLKRYCDPDSLSRLRWEVETSTFLRDARRKYRPSMRRNLDVELVWRRAFEDAAGELTIYKRSIPPGIPERSPFSLNDLLMEDFGHEAAVRRLLSRLDNKH